MSKLRIEGLITIDGTGMPQAPSVRQLQNKDVLMLYTRDTTPDKRQYIRECGVIYYLGDPQSEPRQRGLSDEECIKEAIINYDLPKTYVMDALVSKLSKLYWIQNITEAGVAVNTLKQSIHLISLAANRINDMLNKKLTGDIAEEDISTIFTLMDGITKRVADIPNLTKALSIAEENLREEKVITMARGKTAVTDSMDATKYMS